MGTTVKGSTVFGEKPKRLKGGTLKLIVEEAEAKRTICKETSGSSSRSKGDFKRKWLTDSTNSKAGFKNGSSSREAASSSHENVADYWKGSI